MRSRAIRVVVLAILLLLLAVYLFIWLRIFYYSSFLYSDISTGDRRADVVYGLGPPPATRHPGRGWTAVPDQSAPIWSYPASSGGRVLAVFNPRDGRIDSISCAHPTGETLACPQLYGLSLGMSEEHLRAVFGAPDREQISGDAKSMKYDAIGVEFGLKRYAIYKITLFRDQGGGFGRLYLLARALLPTYH